MGYCRGRSVLARRLEEAVGPQKRSALRWFRCRWVIAARGAGESRISWQLPTSRRLQATLMERAARLLTDPVPITQAVDPPRRCGTWPLICMRLRSSGKQVAIGSRRMQLTARAGSPKQGLLEFSGPYASRVKLRAEAQTRIDNAPRRTSMMAAALITLRSMARVRVLHGEPDSALTGRCTLGCREDQPAPTNPCSLLQEVCS